VLREIDFLVKKLLIDSLFMSHEESSYLTLKFSFSQLSWNFSKIWFIWNSTVLYEIIAFLQPYCDRLSKFICRTRAASLNLYLMCSKHAGIVCCAYTMCEIFITLLFVVPVLLCGWTKSYIVWTARFWSKL